MSAASLSIRLFGPFHVAVGEVPITRPRIRAAEWLLALLVLRQGRPVERSWLAGTLWPESEEAAALQNVRTSLLHLRKALGPAEGRLRVLGRERLALDLEGAVVDLLRFDALVRTGSEAALREAAALYTGHLLEGCAEEWVIADRAARLETCLAALESLADAAMNREDWPEALGYLHRAEGMDPLRNSVQRRLLRALSATGDVPAALLSFREFRTRLHRELNAEPDAQTTRLFREIREKARETSFVTRHPSSVPTASAGGATNPAPHASPKTDAASRITNDGSGPHLPLPPGAAPPLSLTTLVGREEELHQLVEAVGARRLVTLVGGGGVGKTRLAGEIAVRLGASYAAGVAFVSLAPLADPALLASFVATTLGLGETLRDTVPVPSALAERLAQAELLLVLDNCEHLIEGAAELAHALLTRCPRLRILTTSRCRLSLTGEFLWRVPSLPAPNPADLPPVPEEAVAFVLGFPAVGLLVDRAALVRPGFRLVRGEDARVAAEICHRLDGIPLAIELAAARLAVLPLGQIAARLTDRFRLLSDGSRATLLRHQTLRTLVDWSYDLLTAVEQTLLRRLSVFAGGWTLEAAEQVCSDFELTGERRTSPPIVADPNSSIRHQEVFDLLCRLVEQSLMVYQDSEDGGRYLFLETIREYAREKLQASGEEPALRARHLDYFAALAEKTNPLLVGPEQVSWLNRLQAELENFRAALAYCRENEAGIDAGLCLGADLGRFWQARGYVVEGREFLKCVLARDDARMASIPLADRSAVWQRRRALALGCMIRLTSELGLSEGLEQYIHECRVLWQALEDPAGIALTFLMLGGFCCSQGLLKEGRDYYLQSLEHYRKLNDLQRCGVLLNNVALTYKGEESHLARQPLREALAIATEIGDKRGEALYRSNLAHQALEAGNLEEAREMQRAALRIRWQDGAGLALAASLELEGVLCIAEGHFRRGTCMCGAAIALRERLSGSLLWSYGAESRLKTACLALGEAAFAAALAEGRSMPLARVTEYALGSAEPE